MQQIPNTTHTVGCAVELASALTAATIPTDATVTLHRLRNDLQCVEWDVKPYSTNQPWSGRSPPEPKSARWRRITEKEEMFKYLAEGQQ